MLPIKYIVGITVTILGVIVALWGLTDIDPGEVGILVKKIGPGQGMQQQTLDTGIHWVNPFMYDVAVYDVRLQQYDVQDLAAQSKDGQPILVDSSLEIGLIDAQVPYLHETIGKNWYKQVIWPNLRSAVRNETSKLESEAIYTGEGRQEIQDAIQQRLQVKGEPYGIQISVNLRDLSFTNTNFVHTIEAKAQEAQRVVIAERAAEKAVYEANRVAEAARGEKDKAIQAAEGERERLRLQGEGERLQKEEQAKGILAIGQAEAEAIRLKQEALNGAGGQYVVSMKWAEELGKNVQVLGYPLGAEGTTGLFNVDGVLGNALKLPAAASMIGEQ